MKVDWLIVLTWVAAVVLGMSFWYVILHMVGAAPQ